MQTEFERSRHTISGWLVTVTTWFDGRDNQWRCSAPYYAHLFTRHHGDSSGYASRAAAIHGAVGVLASHFRAGPND